MKNREVTIKLPEELNETEVEILILPLNRDKDLTNKIEEKKVENDIIEALEEVKMMRDGKQPEKSARDLLSEL